jgi:hypothetical protein
MADNYLGLAGDLAGQATFAAAGVGRPIDARQPAQGVLGNGFRPVGRFLE